MQQISIKPPLPPLDSEVANQAQDPFSTVFMGILRSNDPLIIERGLPVNAALVQTLFVLMATVEDTTVMNRHCRDKLHKWVRPQAEAFLDGGGFYAADGQQRAAEVDQEFIDHNVSPGGSADLLAVTWFLHRLETMRKVL